MSWATGQEVWTDWQSSFAAAHGLTRGQVIEAAGRNELRSLMGADPDGQRIRAERVAVARQLERRRLAEATARALRGRGPPSVEQRAVDCDLCGGRLPDGQDSTYCQCTSDYSRQIESILLSRLLAARV